VPEIEYSLAKHNTKPEAYSGGFANIAIKNLDFSGKISIVFESRQKNHQNVVFYVNPTVRFPSVAPQTPY